VNLSERSTLASQSEGSPLSPAFRAIVESSSDVFILLDKEQKITYANPAAGWVLGMPPAELIGRAGRDCVSSEELLQLEELLGKVLRAPGGRAGLQFRYQRCGGHWIWLDGTGVNLLHEPEVQAIVCTLRDITQGKQAEAKLRESEELFRLIADAIPHMLWLKRADLSTEYINRRGLQYNGITQEEILAWDWKQAVHPDDAPRVGRQWQETVSRGLAFECEYRLRRADGQYRWHLVRSLPLREDEGQVVKWVGTCTDIHDQKLAEERIHEQAALLDEAQDAILVKDLEGRITYWNKSAERLHGWTAAEALGRRTLDFLYADQKQAMAARAHLFQHGAWQGELIKKNKDGRELIVETRWTLVHSAVGEPKSILAINTDITEKKKLETHLLRAQRMESIGTLAGGIAHDLNNILAPMSISLQVFRRYVTDTEDQKLLDLLETCVQRGADMVRQILSFARGVEGRRMLIGSKYVIQEIERIVRDTFLQQIQLVVRYAKEAWSFLGDPTQIQQVLLNLSVNARDAMPRGGTLTIEAENAMVDDNYAGMNAEAKPGPYVVFSVCDTGMGIPRELHEKIFDPFFTTKEVGRGTGLGLATTAAIVKSHGGFIHLYSEVSRGAVFKVYLPAQPGQVAPAGALKTPLPLGQGECVMVVDDEATIREVTRSTLERFGYQVVLASDGAEALALYAQRRAEIAVVITDMMMPVLDGVTTIHALRRINPEVKIIAASGLMTDTQNRAALEAGAAEILEKPYTADAILLGLNRLLH
jgi:PAS domain S-box-containing protein